MNTNIHLIIVFVITFTCISINNAKKYHNNENTLESFAYQKLNMEKDSSKTTKIKDKINGMVMNSIKEIFYDKNKKHDFVHMFSTPTTIINNKRELNIINFGKSYSIQKNGYNYIVQEYTNGNLTIPSASKLVEELVKNNEEWHPVCMWTGGLYIINDEFVIRLNLDIYSNTIQGYVMSGYLESQKQYSFDKGFLLVYPEYIQILSNDIKKKFCLHNFY